MTTSKTHSNPLRGKRQDPWSMDKIITITNSAQHGSQCLNDIRIKKRYTEHILLSRRCCFLVISDYNTLSAVGQSWAAVFYVGTSNAIRSPVLLENSDHFLSQVSRTDFLPGTGIFRCNTNVLRGCFLSQAIW